MQFAKSPKITTEVESYRSRGIRTAAPAALELWYTAPHKPSFHTHHITPLPLQYKACPTQMPTNRTRMTMTKNRCIVRAIRTTSLVSTACLAQGLEPPPFPLSPFVLFTPGTIVHYYSNNTPPFTLNSYYEAPLPTKVSGSHSHTRPSSTLEHLSKLTTTTTKVHRSTMPW